jgi:hypothetical protein
MAEQAIIFPDDSERGYAVSIDGKVALRTASNRREAAMLNGLVLLGTVDARSADLATEAQTRNAWRGFVQYSAASDPPRRLEIVEVVGLETNPEPSEGVLMHHPHTHAITDGLVVKCPEPASMGPPMGPWGSLTLGAGHLPGAGPVIYLGLHHPNGETLIGTLGLDAYREFGFGMNEVVIRVTAGEFDQPETAQ